MPSTATLTRPTVDNDLTPEMVRLLKAGAAHPYGYLAALRSEATRCGPELMELARRGYQRSVGWDPVITEAGRAAIGAPTENEARNMRLQVAGIEHAALRANAKPVRRDPHADEYLTWKAKGLVCVLTVKHRRCANSHEVSRDGTSFRDQHIYLPDSKTTVLPESSEDFLLALFPRSFVTWLETRDGGKDFAAGQRFRELFGIVLPLSAARPWTDGQVATWGRLDKLRDSINWRIRAARTTPRKTYSKLPFGATA